MRTRADIYGQEASGLLRLISLYPGLLEKQLLRFFPEKEGKIKLLLSHLKRQGRILKTEGGGHFLYTEASPQGDSSLIRAVWVLIDFLDRAEFHCISDFPVKLVFFAGGELYEIIHIPMGQEILINQALFRSKEQGSRRIVLVDSPEQIDRVEFPGISGFCTVTDAGQVNYFKRRNDH